MIIEKAAVVVFEIDVLYSELFQYFVCFHLFIFFLSDVRYIQARDSGCCVCVFFSLLLCILKSWNFVCARKHYTKYIEYSIFLLTKKTTFFASHIFCFIKKHCVLFSLFGPSLVHLFIVCDLCFCLSFVLIYYMNLWSRSFWFEMHIF